MSAKNLSARPPQSCCAGTTTTSAIYPGGAVARSVRDLDLRNHAAANPGQDGASLLRQIPGRFSDRCEALGARAAAASSAPVVRPGLLPARGEFKESRASNRARSRRQVCRDDYDQLRALAGNRRLHRRRDSQHRFQKPYPAIDGNVRRVLRRLFRITHEEASARRRSSNSCPELGQATSIKLDGTRRHCLHAEKSALLRVPGRIVECASRQPSLPEPVPSSRARTKIQNVTWPLAIVRRSGKILLRRRAADGLLAGLWELPGDRDRAWQQRLAHFGQHLTRIAAVKAARRRCIGDIRHAITHRRIRAPIYVFDWCANSAPTPPRGRWRWIAPAGCTNKRSRR